MNLIDKIREDMGYPAFVKMDPNTQEPSANEQPGDERQRTGQATITAVLAGFYQLSRSEEGFQYLLNKDKNVPWSMALFGEAAEPVVEKISQYGGTPAGEVSDLVHEAGNSTLKNIEESLEGHFDYASFSKIFNGIHTSLLQYLPAEMQLGRLINDNSMDDRTHKMEGPVSGLMHKIEEIF